MASLQSHPLWRMNLPLTHLWESSMSHQVFGSFTHNSKCGCPSSSLYAQYREKSVQDHVKQTDPIEAMRSLRKEKDAFRVPKEWWCTADLKPLMALQYDYPYSTNCLHETTGSNHSSSALILDVNYFEAQFSSEMSSQVVFGICLGLFSLIWGIEQLLSLNKNK